MKASDSSCIRSWERNIHGGIVIWGLIGIRHYYGYTLKVAKQKYIRECEQFAHQ